MVTHSKSVYSPALQRTALAALFLFASPAIAFENLVCVTTPAELQTALTNAQNASADVLIEVTAGTYLLDSPLQYSGPAGGVTIEGGYTGSLEEGLCSHQTLDPTLTVLDGQQQRHILGFQTISSSLSLKYLTFQYGKLDSPIGPHGIVSIGNSTSSSPASGAIDISNNIFRNNLAQLSNAAIVYAENTNNISLTNNLFIRNTVVSSNVISIFFYAAGTAVLNNNTVSDNACLPSQSGVNPGYGVQVVTNVGQVSVANNILFGNQGCEDDLYFNGSDPAATLAFYSNDVGTFVFPNSGGARLSGSDNQAVIPEFVPGSYRLTSTSPLINAGDNSATGGIGSIDVAGNPRIVFDTVDIGAYELQDDIFNNGFE